MVVVESRSSSEFGELNIFKERLQSEPLYLPSRADVIAAFPSAPGGVNTDWRNFCLETDKGNYRFFDLLTTEFVVALGTYLQQRAAIYRETTGSPVTILEVGAGNGRLAHFMREELSAEDIRYVASDSGSYGFSHLFPSEQMALLPHTTALEEYSPTIVISAWMESNEDWTRAFRSTSSVQEYLLIGRDNFGGCGHPWFTWGVASTLNPLRGTPIAYKQDGFERRDIRDISRHQLCWKDNDPQRMSVSKTVSFRRVIEDVASS